jgi:hypothetical protein
MKDQERIVREVCAMWAEGKASGEGVLAQTRSECGRYHEYRGHGRLRAEPLDQQQHHRAEQLLI